MPPAVLGDDMGRYFIYAAKNIHHIIPTSIL